MHEAHGGQFLLVGERGRGLLFLVSSCLQLGYCWQQPKRTWFGFSFPPVVWDSETLLDPQPQFGCRGSCEKHSP